MPPGPPCGEERAGGFRWEEWPSGLRGEDRLGGDLARTRCTGRHGQPRPGHPGRRCCALARPRPAGAPPMPGSTTSRRSGSTERPGSWRPGPTTRRSPTSTARPPSRRWPRRCSPTPPWSAWPTCCAAITSPWASFDPSGYQWPRPIPARYRTGLVSHNDVHPANLVFRGGRAVGLIDFDLAGPGGAAWDFAAAARYWAPLQDDQDIADSRRGRALERFRIFLHASGLDRADRRRGGRGSSGQSRLDLRDRHRGSRGRPLRASPTTGAWRPSPLPAPGCWCQRHQRHR